MKKTLLSLAIACLAAPSVQAQLNGDGYYRIQNVKTQRYMSLCDNKSAGVSTSAMVVDAAALVTKKDVAEILTDPGSIFYIKKIDDSNYDISAQGADVHSMINYYIRITALNDGTYKAWQTEGGQTLFLNDRVKDNEFDAAVSYVTTISDNSDDDHKQLKNWYIHPVNESDSYLGVKPMFEQGGKYYTTFYAEFPFSFASTGMRALYVNKLLDNGIATYKVIEGTVPAQTPVIIECSSADPAQNKLKIETSSPARLTDNLLTGVYFGWGHIASDHFNSTAFDTTTMRVLGTSADGSLALNNADTYMADILTKVEVGYDDYKYPTVKSIPHNTAYVSVNADTPAELKLYVEGDPATNSIKEVSGSDSDTTAPVYSLSGTMIRRAATSTTGLPKGIYIFKGKKTVVR